MKKILATFDSLKYSAATENYAIYLAKQTNTHLVGVFMDDQLYRSYSIYQLVVKEGVSDERIKKYEAKDKADRAAAAKHFETACRSNALEYSIHHDRNTAIQELKHESIYADLLIVDAKETLTNYPEKAPTRFIRELLGDAQCAVMIIPEKYKPIQKVILLYDGEPSSVHAIKMFSYLLPQLKHLDAEVVSVNPVDASLHLPDNRLMKEFMKRHFPKAKYAVMKGVAEHEIVQYLKYKKENSLVVLGAYRRGMVSRWFRESMADILMREVDLPLFIAHSK